MPIADKMGEESALIPSGTACRKHDERWNGRGVEKSETMDRGEVTRLKRDECVGGSVMARSRVVPD